jgi:hypothetical protein
MTRQPDSDTASRHRMTADRSRPGTLNRHLDLDPGREHPAVSQNVAARPAGCSTNRRPDDTPRQPTLDRRTHIRPLGAKAVPGLGCQRGRDEVDQIGLIRDVGGADVGTSDVPSVCW